MDPQGRALDQGRRRKHRLVERINEILQEQGRRWEDLTSEERHAMKEQIRTEERYIMKTPAKEGNKQMSKEDRQQARKESRQQARKESRQQARKEQRQQARQEETDSQIKDKKEKGRKPGKKGDKKAGRFDGMTEELKAQLRGQIIAIRHDSNMSTLEKKEAIRDLLKSARQA